jgi:8-oxo-dGTP diphosphatase
LKSPTNSVKTSKLAMPVMSWLWRISARQPKTAGSAPWFHHPPKEPRSQATIALAERRRFTRHHSPPAVVESRWFIMHRRMKDQRTTDNPDPAARAYPQRPIVSAHAVVFRDDRVLLARRAHEPSQGRWSVPGGGIELGETIRDAVQREVREECGIEIETDRIIDVVDNIIPDDSEHIRFHYVVVYLMAHHVSGRARPGSDASEVRWAIRAELDGFDMHPLARKALQRAFELARECRYDQSRKEKS